jgi:hypothetical protein
MTYSLPWFNRKPKWQLSKGGHDTPEEGTCVTEAAVLAAGLEYRKITRVADCPPCFSRPIAAFAMKLNDVMPDDLRQKLLWPFVNRLAGTADTELIERRRAVYLFTETVRRVLCRPEQGKGLRTFEDCRQAIFNSLRNEGPLSSAFILCAAAEAIATPGGDVSRALEFVGEDCAIEIAGLMAFRVATEILDGAIRLGRHGETPRRVVAARLEQARDGVNGVERTLAQHNRTQSAA